MLLNLLGCVFYFRSDETPITAERNIIDEQKVLALKRLIIIENVRKKIL
jgi:hypothetical protein